jgi:hypothetical protein
VSKKFVRNGAKELINKTLARAIHDTVDAAVGIVGRPGGGAVLRVAVPVALRSGRG